MKLAKLGHWERLLQAVICRRNFGNLASTFNKQLSRIPAVSPKLSKGLFAIPELASSEGFIALEERVKSDTDDLVAESVDNGRQRKMVEVFDELSDTLCQVADLAEFVRIAHPDRKFSEAAENACININALVERLNTNVELYTSLRRATEESDVAPLTSVDEHVSRLFLFDFEQSGIHLPESLRESIVGLNDRILRLGQRFAMNSHEPRRIPKHLLPPHLANNFPSHGNNVVISSFHADSSNEQAREAAYKLYLYPDKSQEEILDELLLARYELANLCGYPTFADRTLKNSIAGSPGLVKDFLDVLKIELERRALEEYDVMRHLKKKDVGARDELYCWDPPYLTAILKKQIQGLKSSDFAPYFSIGNCMEGLNLIFQALFDITLEPCVLEEGESWHSDVHKIAVVHAQEGLLGYIYCDFFERHGKPHQDCHFTIVGGRTLSNGNYQVC
ncbi:mitochondrial intermediate peptidase-like isoform X1 [Artemia franciscana]|uniref:mitochondrial intermediate peptidase-like isoform X1 n=1 Tax=Artemia franciscana TaxID=6661 RepID=UPI0032DB83FC